MDLSFDETQQAVIELATTVFSGEVDDERVKRVESTADTFDRELWATLASTGLLAMAIPEAYGGSGGGVIEAACVIEQQGRHLAQLPLAATIGGGLLLATLGDADLRQRWLGRLATGEASLAWSVGMPLATVGATPPRARAEGGRWRLDGVIPNVALAATADALILPALVGDGGRGLFLAELGGPGVTSEAVQATDRMARAHVTLHAAPASILDAGAGDPVTSFAAVQRIILTAVAVGVGAEALRRAAAYTSERFQFGKPLSSFQSTAHKAADAYIDVEAIRHTLWQAASLLDEGLDPAAAASAATVAAWWAADATPRVVTAVQHLHGGLGADVDYPIHRFFLWGTQIEHDLGGAAALLAEIGDNLAAGIRTRQEIVE